MSGSRDVSAAWCARSRVVVAASRVRGTPWPAAAAAAAACLFRHGAAVVVMARGSARGVARWRSACPSWARADSCSPCLRSSFSCCPGLAVRWGSAAAGLGLGAGCTEVLAAPPQPVPCSQGCVFAGTHSCSYAPRPEVYPNLVTQVGSMSSSS